jgi:hypothetical protein
MGLARNIEVRIIPAPIAAPFVRRVHYSHKCVNNSQLHFGVFYEGGLHGVASFGPSTDWRKMLPLLKGLQHGEFLELNRLAFDDVLPRNSESRALGIMLRYLRKHAPHLKIVISFADACQCGDGTIYRASGFVLTGIHRNNALWRLPSGEIVHNLFFSLAFNSKVMKPFKQGARSQREVKERSGAVRVEGFQLRYVYFLHPEERANLQAPILPFSVIDEMGARMYRGRGVNSSTPGNHPEGGGASPTRPLQIAGGEHA